MALNSAPSVRRLCLISGVTEDVANEIRRQIHDLPAFPSVKLFRQILNLVPGTYGTEVICPKTKNAPTIIYANMGDPHTRTLIVTERGKAVTWAVCGWGDIVSAYEGQYE